MKPFACELRHVVSARNGAGELVGIGVRSATLQLIRRFLDLIIAPPEYQRQGLGRAMMKKIAAQAKGTSIYFETERKNFAFAAKCGYKKRGG